MRGDIRDMVVMVLRGLAIGLEKMDGTEPQIVAAKLRGFLADEFNEEI